MVIIFKVIVCVLVALGLKECADIKRRLIKQAKRK